MKNTIKFCSIAMLMLISACGMNEDEKDSNEEVLESVLNHLLIAPDEKLIELLNDPDNYTEIGEGVDKSEAEEPQNDEGTELDNYYRELYGTYFTEEVYQDFISVYAPEFQLRADEKSDEIDVDTMDIENTDEANRRYDFTVELNCTNKQEKENQAEKATVKGYANFSKDGKITRFILTDDEGLLSVE